MKKVLFSLFLGFLLIAVSFNSYAETRDTGDYARNGFREGMPMMPPVNHSCIGIMDGMSKAGHHMWLHLMGLGLDEKQKGEVKEIRSRVMKEIIKKMADVHIAGIELKDLLDKDSVDMKAVEAKLKQIETLKTETHLLLIKAREDIKSKLRPEQRKKFKDALELDPMIGGMIHGGMRMPYKHGGMQDYIHHKLK